MKLVFGWQHRVCCGHQTGGQQGKEEDSRHRLRNDDEGLLLRDDASALADVMGRILAVDHGTVRIGLALSDEMQLIASPWMTLQNGPKVVEELARKIREKQIEKVVVGAPLLLSGAKGTAMERVERFAELLGKALEHEIPVELVDERLSSVTAEKALKREGHVIDAKEGVVDQLAATVILQDYLNSSRGPDGYLLPDDADDMPWMHDEPRRKKK